MKINRITALFPFMLLVACTHRVPTATVELIDTSMSIAPQAEKSALDAVQSSGAMKRIEIYAGGRHLGTYDIASNATYFIHGDWQGSERMRTTASGTSYETCTNLPFGDGQQCSGGADISPMHYTGKMRDTETNLDYFGARYYGSGSARWMSPDWADKPTDVPYAMRGDPQSLNLYAFVGDNPVSKQDADGHLMTLGTEQGGDGTHDGGMSSAGPLDLEQATQDLAQDAHNNKTSHTGGGFWSRLKQGFSNLIHGHLWDYASVTTTATYAALAPMANAAAVAAKAAANPPGSPTPPPIQRPVPGPDPVPPQLKPGTLPEIQPGASMQEKLGLGAAGSLNLFNTITSEFIICFTCSSEEFHKQMYPYGDGTA